MYHKFFFVHFLLHLKNTGHNQLHICHFPSFSVSKYIILDKISFKNSDFGKILHHLYYFRLYVLHVVGFWKKSSSFLVNHVIIVFISMKHVKTNFIFINHVKVNLISTKHVKIVFIFVKHVKTFFILTKHVKNSFISIKHVKIVFIKHESRKNYLHFRKSRKNYPHCCDLCQNLLHTG